MAKDVSKLSDSELDAEIAQLEGFSDKKKDPGESFLSKVMRQGALGARALASGVAGIGDLPSMPFKAMGMIDRLPSEAMAHNIDVLTGGYTKPRTKTEKVVQDVGTSLAELGTGAGAVKAGIKGAGKAAKFIKDFYAPTATNIGSTVGATGAVSALEPSGPISSLLTGVGGGLAGGMGARSLNRLPIQDYLTNPIETFKAHRPVKTYVGENVLGIQPEKVKQFEEAGLSPSAYDVTDSEPLRMTHQFLQKIPVVGKPIKDFRQKQREEFFNKLGRDVEGEGPTRSQTGDVATDVFTRRNTEANKIWQTYDSKIDDVIKKSEIPTRLVPTKNTSNFFKNQLKDIEEEALKEDWHVSPVGKFYKLIDKASDQFGGKVTYNGLNRIRKKIDKAIKWEDVRAPEDIYLLKQLRSNVVDDMDSYLKNYAPEALPLIKERNKLYSDYLKHEEPFTTPVRQAAKDRGGMEAFNKLVTSFTDKKTPRELQVFYKYASPEEARGMTDGLIDHLGKSKAGWEPSTFFRNFKTLPKSHQNLMLKGFDKNMQKDVYKLAKNYESVKQTFDLNNTSFSGMHDNFWKMVAGFGKAAAGAGSALYTGHLAGLGTLGQMLGGGIAALYMTKNRLMNPDYVKEVAKLIEIKNLRQLQGFIEHGEKKGGAARSLASSLRSIISGKENSSTETESNSRQMDQSSYRSPSEMTDEEIEAEERMLLGS